MNKIFLPILAVIGAVAAYGIFNLGLSSSPEEDGQYVDNSVQYVGKPAPTIEIDYWISGESNLEKKWIFVEFLEPWCPHCAAISDDVNKMFTKNKDWLEVVGVTSDLEKATEWKKYPQYRVPQYPLGHRNPDGEKLGLSGVPYGLLINPCGIVVWQSSLSASTLEGEEVLYLQQQDLDLYRRKDMTSVCGNLSPKPIFKIGKT